jgi:hypothetical protein
MLNADQLHPTLKAYQIWEKLAEPLPFKPGGIAYNAKSKSIYAWHSSEKKAADAILRWDLL